MSRVSSLYSTSVGKKVTMAATGTVFVLFVIVHLFGNLKVYQGREAFNAYAEGLREFGAPFLGYGQFLWVARFVLLFAVVLHVTAALQLTWMSWTARGTRYKKRVSLALSYTSRTMRWGGLLLFFFIAYHLMHLTTGHLHPDFVPGDAYHNFVAGFELWPISAAYVVAMLALGLHLYHGIWSGFQTLGLNGPLSSRIRRPLAAGISVLVAIGNISFPVAVLTGFVE